MQQQEVTIKKISLKRAVLTFEYCNFKRRKYGLRNVEIQQIAL